MQLTTEQLQAIDAGKAIAVSLDHRSCVVVRQDVYEKMVPEIRGSLSPETVGILVQDAMAEYDADDPLLDSYQQVD